MTANAEAMLLVEKGVEGQTGVPLDKDSFVVGNAPDADFVVSNPYVSRLHARIDREGARFIVRYLQSRNGTSVNGDRIGDDGRELRDGDRIELAGGQVALRFKERTVTLALDAVPETPAGDLTVDARAREVWVRGDHVQPPLSRKEFDVLNLLCERTGQACSRDEIAAAGWPERTDSDVGDQEIDQCIRRLRVRIELDSSRPAYIVTVRGYGYKLSP